ncbi:zinc finger BED domain-containing protein RICESLEEPER 2-like [Arachis hypogaea]|uniref:zinc finger BED domain-containing protein RICESLEEPER 2-like n=1 Tax=Arachis hypogaea TaxID=3818 RepID=UPI000DECB514|nr:zinc finger BED domain-containing protein RICESLEEPER 2-like [Arachis hypogaea]
MPPPHTGFELSSKIFELLNEWGIEKKIMTLTLDNASANDTCQDHLKSTLNMHDWLLCDGEFFHIRCFAHILNLIMQDGLKITHDALDKIRESVKYVRGSKSRMIRFKECVSAIQGLNFTSGFHLDVTTRWNSTYIMLESAIKYRKAFEYLKATDHAYKYCPSVDEWGRAEKICEFLYPFYETTNLISGTSYPTSNLYFLQVYHIQCVLMGSLRSEDELLRSMEEKMMNKFKKYWEKYSVILAFGAILDPRLKISTLELMYEEIDAETAKGKVEHVKKKLYKLFEKYDKNSLPTVQAQGPSIQSSSMAHTPESAIKKRLAIVGKLMKRNHQAEVSSGKNPLNTYLEEPLLSKDCFEDLDVLECIGAHVINKYRSQMLPENVEAVICTRNWNKGFVDGEGEGEDVNPQGARRGGVLTSESDSNFIDLEVDN